MIEVRHLTKQYDEHTAVEDLSFVVEDGIIYGFLGPNGAGKTTTMNIMTGYLSPTEGEVLINGFDMLEQPEAAKRTIGYLPEVPPVYPDMTVFEYLSFAAELKKVPAAARAPQIEEILAALLNSQRSILIGGAVLHKMLGIQVDDVDAEIVPRQRLGDPAEGETLGVHAADGVAQYLHRRPVAG